MDRVPPSPATPPGGLRGTIRCPAIDRGRRYSKWQAWACRAVQLNIEPLLSQSFYFRCGLWTQPIDATTWWNRSAGVSKFKVFLGRSFSLLATALSFACE
jgi:hypothetical protein